MTPELDPTDPGTGHAANSVPPDQPSAPDAQVTLAREALVLTTEWVVSGRVRLRRRVVSETRTVEVTVRREELLIDTDTVTTSPTGALSGTLIAGRAVDRQTASPGPMVILLREEVPDVVLATRAYERVTVRLDMAADIQSVTVDLRHEEALIDEESATPPAK